MSFVTKKIWVLYMVCMLLSLPSFAAWKPAVTESNTPESILSRLKPIGELDIEGEQPQQQNVLQKALGPDAGKKRYEASCAVCHAQGIAGAPKFRDQSDWEARVAQGLDTILQSAIQGVGQMPPKGTCMSCSDEEIKVAIEYMLPQ